MKLLILWSAIALASVGVEACAPTPVDADYGTSVHQMIVDQTADPGAAKQSGATAVKGEDPAVIEQALKSMRAEKADRAQIGQPIAVGIGGPGNP